jgi:phage baseplate assembly protein W
MDSQDIDGLFSRVPRSFYDLGTSFARNPVTGDALRVRDEAAVLQAMKNLVMTKFGERLMDPSIGSDVYGMLFEPLDAFSSMELQDKILNTIRNFEPRVEVLDVTVSAAETSDDIVSVDITFRIIGEPNIINQQFILERPSS